MGTVELRQLRYFATLAEVLHFGKAAAREHIVQSALSQQLQRLERELGVLLLERTTHHVRLTPPGAAFLAEARQIIAHVERAAAAARYAACGGPRLRACIGDASHSLMPEILRELEGKHPDLTVHQIERPVTEQIKLLMDGRLDVGIGRASMAPPEVASELIRLDPLGILVPENHRFADLHAVPVTALSEESLLFTKTQRSPEYNQFVIELCRSAGFMPSLYQGSVDSIQAAISLVVRGRCVVCASALMHPLSGLVWRPLTEPEARYPWSVLWRADDDTEYVRALVMCARTLSRELGWLSKNVAGELDY